MTKKKRVLVYFGHPAQFLFLRPTIKKLENENIEFKILIKSKDVLEDLIKAEEFDYRNIMPKPRGNSKFSIVASLLKRMFRIAPLVLRFKPDLMISTDASLMQLGKLFRIKTVTITEDDYDIVKSLAKVTYPFANFILCPEVCSVGPYNSKKIGYEGYMKLAYLHPDVFRPDDKIISDYNLPPKFAILRLAKLTAYHDDGIYGLNKNVVLTLIELLKNKGISTLISGEQELDNELERYRIKILPQHIHHVMSTAQILISDSQSMSVEASILGVPSIRYSSFVGKISVLEELEHKYQLTFGVLAGEEQSLVNKLEEVLRMDKNDFKSRRMIMLNDKINVTNFLCWFISEFPDSAKEMQLNSRKQLDFK